MKKVDKGGITYGKSHDDGGIPVKNASTGQMLEVEGGEGILNKRSMASDKKVKMNGKEMTICEAASKLNEMEGGVKFSCDDVEHRQFIEQMELGGELERGIRTEKEHIETLMKLYENRITPTKAVEEVAKEHIAENPNYYSDMEQMEDSKVESISMPTTTDMMFDFQVKRVAEKANVPSFERSGSKVEDIREFKDGGMFGRTCGCKNHKRKYLDGGMFDSGFGSLDNFIGQAAKKDEGKKDAEYSLEVIEKARKILDKDYLPMILSSSMSPKYKIYFQQLKKLNLYQEGWRFKFGSSREWAGLCAYRGLTFDKSKTLYLSINFVKHDANWLENEKDTILHEMAHAIVDEYMITKVIDFVSVDPAHKVNEGHGEAWEQVCKAINPEGNCDRFYGNAKLKDSFLPYMYECAFCNTKKYSRNRNFTNVCFKCMKPVIVIKND